MTSAFKKGQLSPMLGLIAIVLLLVLGVSAILINSTVGELTSELTSDFTHNESKAVTTDMNTRMPSWLDGMFALVLGMLIIGGLIAGYFVDTAPIFLLIDILLLFFLIIGGAAVSNMYEDFISSDEVSSFESSFPVTDWVLDHLVLVAGIYVVLMMSIIYYKSRVLV